MAKMINTRIAFEKSGINSTYVSWMQSKIRSHGIDNYRVTYSRENRRKLTIFMEKEDWEKIIGGLKNGEVN